MISFPGIKAAEIYLPNDTVDLEKWAVIACDQYTSQPEYWERAEQFVGDAPSTLHLTLPEIYLDDVSSRVPVINETMRRYLCDGILEKKISEGFLLVERTTPSGARIGLLAALDLEDYDFTGKPVRTRATEDTITARIPPRIRIRENAPMELPHIMVLLDDPEKTVIEPLYRKQRETTPLYDVELMAGGGRLCGWAVEAQMELQVLSDALWALDRTSGGFLYAVGDGNHSLATAKTHWERVKQTLSPEEAAQHPARYALVELVNLHCDALCFEPIHRVLFHTNGNDLLQAFRTYLEKKGIREEPGKDVCFRFGAENLSMRLQSPDGLLPVAIVQDFLDGYLKNHPEAAIDYVHGEDIVTSLSRKENTVGVLLQGIRKDRLFPGIAAGGHLPRKTFSMGEAFEKRYYMECRMIR